jgi:hypothetical protein
MAMKSLAAQNVVVFNGNRKVVEVRWAVLLHPAVERLRARAATQPVAGRAA